MVYGVASIVSALATASSSDMPVNACAWRNLPLFLSSTNAPTQIPGITVSTAFGAFGPPRSVRHHPGSVKLIMTFVPSRRDARSFVNLSSAALLAA